MPEPPQADRDQLLAFRLAGHNLARRLPPGSLLEAAAACGISNYPPGSAELAFNARILDLTPAEIVRALETDRTLLQIRSLRTAPHLFPVRDARIFTIGLLPEDEESLRFLLLGAVPALERVGISATRLVELTAEALLDALDGSQVTFRRLSAQLTERVSQPLSPRQLDSWQSPSWYGPNQCLGEALVHFALYAVALEGLYCFAPRQGREASFVRIDQWLGERLPAADPDEARAELVRRYLRCYGPSTAAHFAEWAGIAPAPAGRAWNLIRSELVEVCIQGKIVWLQERDLPDFESPPAPKGVRLLPPHDPYLAQRDRETLLPERALHRQVWRAVGNPGIVLAQGRVVGMWRPEKRGRRLLVTVEPFTALTGRIRSEVVAEASRMAPFRGCTAADAVFAG